MLSEVRQIFFEYICEEKHAFNINEYSQKYFSCVWKTLPVYYNKIPCVFPVWKK